MSTPALDIEELILQTDAYGAPVRLECVRGRMKWEASPASRHQKTVDRIRATLAPKPGYTPGCGCFSLGDTLIRFPDPDHSLKRPDIAIFCDEPPDLDEALDLLPSAVIEILSPGYEEKDLGDDGAPFYLACGVTDVLVVDPRAGLVYHYRADRPRTEHRTPVTLELVCGCRVSV
jgi:hypothetical protein